jgi:hypothetical protein
MFQIVFISLHEFETIVMDWLEKKLMEIDRSFAYPLMKIISGHKNPGPLIDTNYSIKTHCYNWFLFCKSCINHILIIHIHSQTFQYCFIKWIKMPHFILSPGNIESLHQSFMIRQEFARLIDTRSNWLHQCHLTHRLAINQNKCSDFHMQSKFSSLQLYRNVVKDVFRHIVSM